MRLGIACSLPYNEAHELDAAEQGVDVTPPAPPTIVDVEVFRNPPPDGCSGAATSCDGSGAIHVRVTAGADDRTQPGDLGVRLTGSELARPDPIRPDADGAIYLAFSDRGQALDETLTITTVDLAGNESEPITVAITSPAESDGCRTTDAGAWLPVVAALALVWLRTRASARPCPTRTGTRDRRTSASRRRAAPGRRRG